MCQAVACMSYASVVHLRASSQMSPHRHTSERCTTHSKKKNPMSELNADIKNQIMKL